MKSEIIEFEGFLMLSFVYKYIFFI